jgi:nucleotide-binding universal stress UspA family protein
LANSPNNSMLVAINDSISSRAAIDFLCKLPFSHQNINIKLVHILRKPVSGEELMGKEFMEKQPERLMAMLEKSKDKLVEHGFLPEKIEIELVSENYQTVGDGIIDRFRKGNYNMVVIGRKRMSKAEEFVLGDPSVKLIRTLEKSAVMVVKSV